MGVPARAGSWTAPCSDLAEARHAHRIGAAPEGDDEFGRRRHADGESTGIELHSVLGARAQPRAVTLEEVDLRAQLHRRPRRIDHDLQDVDAADQPRRPALLDRDATRSVQVGGDVAAGGAPRIRHPAAANGPDHDREHNPHHHEDDYHLDQREPGDLIPAQDRWTWHRRPPVERRIPDRKSTRLNSSHGYISYA